MRALAEIVGWIVVLGTVIAFCGCLALVTTGLSLVMISSGQLAPGIFLLPLGLVLCVLTLGMLASLVVDVRKTWARR